MGRNTVFILAAFLIMLFIFINELKNITAFIFKYNSIKDMATINMEQTCRNVYCEAESHRFQLAKHVYDLVLPNDIYNAKTYTILILVYSIIMFIAVYYWFTAFLIEKKFKNIDWFRFALAIYFFIYILANILARFVPYDTKGYLTYFKDGGSNGLNSTMIIALVGGTILYLILNRPQDTFNKVETFFITIYFWFAAIFLFNMINIVETFKDNKVPHDMYLSNSESYTNNWTADISHGSEGYFYYKYFNLKSIPQSIFYIQNNTINYFYNVNPFYQSILQYGLVSFVFICLFFIVFGILYMILRKEEGIQELFQKCLSKILPVVILLFLIIYVSNFTTFNTSFNKLVLYGATSSCYKRALNELNNVVTPFIAMHNNYTGAGVSSQKNYLYHYITLNVLISYLKNYIQLKDNTSSTTEDVNALFDNFKNKAYIDANKIKFNQISVNEINDIHKFEEYYKYLFRKVLDYEFDEIPTNLTKEQIEAKYITLLTKVFANGDSDAMKHLVKLQKIDVAGTAYKFANFHVYRENILNSIYYCVNLLNQNDFNKNIEEYNKVDPANTIRNELLNTFYFYIENDYTCNAYKFLLKPSSTIPTAPAASSRHPTAPVATYRKMHEKLVKELDIQYVVEAFLTHLRSIYEDYLQYSKAGNSDTNKVSIFYGNIYPSLQLLSSITNTNEINMKERSVAYLKDIGINVYEYNDYTITPTLVTISDTTKVKRTEDDNLKPLFKLMKEKIVVNIKASNNYLKNGIENMYFQLNDSTSTVKLYNIDKDADSKKFDIVKEDDSDVQNKNVFDTEVDANLIANTVDSVLHKANYVAREHFFLTYLVNIIILYCAYLAVTKIKI